MGPIWRDPRRNSVQKAVPGVPHGGMATHLVTKRCDFGALGVQGPASTPLGPGPWRLPAGSRLLACLLCLALAWSGLGLSCLPCQQQQPAAFGGRRRLRRRCCCCWTRPRQDRRDRPRPDQAKAGHNRQASQAKAAGYKLAGFSVSRLILVSRLVISRDSRLAMFSTMHCMYIIHWPRPL